MKMREATEVVRGMAEGTPYMLQFAIASWLGVPRYTIYLADKGGHSEGRDWDEAINAAKMKMPGYQPTIPTPLPDEEDL